MSREDDVVMAIDPGKTCGWTLGSGLEFHDAHQGNPQNLYDFLFLAITSGCINKVVCERFDARRLDNDAIATIEVIGVVRYLTHVYAINFKMVNAADKKRTMAKALKNLARWESVHQNSQHIRDAEAIRLWDYRYGRW